MGPDDPRWRLIFAGAMALAAQGVVEFSPGELLASMPSRGADLAGSLAEVVRQPPRSGRKVRVSLREVGANRLGLYGPSERPVRAGDPDAMATAYFWLGLAVADEGDFGLAKEWLEHSLNIREELGDRDAAGGVAHYLGVVLQRSGDLDGAAQLYERSLASAEEFEKDARLAATTHQLGALADQRGELDAARAWYERSLQVKERLADEKGIAKTLHHWGLSLTGAGNSNLRSTCTDSLWTSVNELATAWARPPPTT